MLRFRPVCQSQIRYLCWNVRTNCLPRAHVPCALLWQPWSCLIAVCLYLSRLQELAEMPSARQKRILANRQSAARSKERKLAYISELEAQVPCPTAP